MKLVFLFLAFAFSSCVASRNEPQLASINLIGANGISETISNEGRLKQFQKVNFLVPQPYKKVLRVYKRDPEGNITACITTYHPNGELKQYLELVNGRAFGEYGVWYDSGRRKIKAQVIGGNGDLYEGVENSWVFDEVCYAYDEQGSLEAAIPYVKGKRNGTALYYHTNGALWKEIPLENDCVHGTYLVYLSDGSLFEKITYCEGKKEGKAFKYWKEGKICYEETYQTDNLINGLYYSIEGDLISEVKCGNGFKAVFGKDCVQEFREYREGVEEGLVKVVDKNGTVTRVYGVKNGLKHGEEIEYYPVTKKPKLSIGWNQGKVQGLVKTWYPNGGQESQREMAGNKRMGILTAWYSDGSLMLLENYDQDKLVKGEYFKQGETFPVSTVTNGNGIATLFDANGLFLYKVNYRYGQPED
ncbi:MAG: toxin-antitoxin system YwqK family antitoxin [Parachlamydiaceae bacterium]